MTAKTLLKKCRAEKRELLILAEKREALATSLLPKAMAIKEISVQESADSDPLADRMAAVIDLEKEIDRQMAIMLRHDLDAHRLVGRLRNSRQRQMIELYYLTFKVDPEGNHHLYTWEMVAEELEISERWLWKQIPDAFRELKKIEY